MKYEHVQESLALAVVDFVRFSLLSTNLRRSLLGEMDVGLKWQGTLNSAESSTSICGGKHNDIEIKSLWNLQ